MSDYDISRPGSVLIWNWRDEKEALRDLYPPAPNSSSSSRNSSISSVYSDISNPKSQGLVSAASSTQVPAGLLVNLSKARAVAVAITLSAASFLHGYTQQAMFILLPIITADLNISASRGGWLTAAYALGFSSAFLLMGRLGDVYGHRRVFLAACVWMLAIMVINPFLTNQWAFFIARGFHGMGAGAMSNNLIGVRNSIFAPGSRRKHAFMSCWMAGPAGTMVGNITSGLIAEYLDWRWVFCVISAIDLFVIAGTLYLIPTDIKQSSAAINAVASRLDQTMRLDWPGALLWSSGVLLLLIAITEAGASGWEDVWVPVTTVIGVLLIASFVFWERLVEKRERPPLPVAGGGGGGDTKGSSSSTPAPSPQACGLKARAPLVRLSNFRGQPPLIAGLAVLFLVVTAFSGFLNMTTSYFQTYQVLDPLGTALRLIPIGVVSFLTMALMTQLLHRLSVCAIAATGAVCVALANLVMAIPTIAPQTSYFAYNLPTMVTAAFGWDFINVTLSRYTCSKVEDDDSLEGGITVMVAQLGRATGVAITTALRIAVVRFNGVPSGELEFGTQASLDGLKTAFWANSWLSWAAVCIALLVMRKEGPLEPNISWAQAST